MPKKQNKKHAGRSNSRSVTVPSASTGALSRIERINLASQKDVVPRSIKTKTYQICRSYEVGTILTGVSAPATSALLFTLNSVPNSADFTNLFDSYRILMALVSFMPFVTETNTSTQHPGFIHTVLDYDDATPLTTVQQAEQYSDTYKAFSLLTSFTRCLEPAPAQAIYNGVTTTGYSRAANGSRGPWMDSSAAGIEYFGLKYVTDGTLVATASAASAVKVELWCEFKSPN